MTSNDRWFARRWRDAFGARTSGFPTSSNRASSLHLRWLGLPTHERLVEASVVLEIAVAPVVPHLYFWALQASFVDGTRPAGAGHLGLQWYPAHPGSTAVNWGGYDAAGRELDGTTSELPSATGNPNTRDLAWVPGSSLPVDDQRWVPARLVARIGRPAGHPRVARRRCRSGRPAGVVRGVRPLR